MANQFSARIDKDSTLAYYGFGGWHPGNSIPILLLFVLGMNVLVYWGLLPARSRLRLQEEEDERGATAAAGGRKGVRALDFLRGSAESMDGFSGEGKDEQDGPLSLRRPLLPSLPRASSKEDGMMLPSLPTVAPQAAAAAAKRGGGGGGGLKQKLLAADEKDLSIPQVLLESLTGTSDTALIDSRLNDTHHHATSSSALGAAWPPASPPAPPLDVKDYELRSTHIQKSRGIRLLFRDVVYSIPAADAANDQRGPLLRCLLRSSQRRRRGSEGEEQGRRVLLKGASGRVNPGEMCALMGGSGAGAHLFCVCLYLWAWGRSMCAVPFLSLADLRWSCARILINRQDDTVGCAGGPQDGRVHHGGGVFQRPPGPPLPQALLLRHAGQSAGEERERPGDCI